MKWLILLVTTGLTAWGAQAQGRFMLANRCLTCSPPLDVRVMWQAHGWPPHCNVLEGWAYWAQACIRPAGDPDSCFRPVGEPVHCGTGIDAGYIEPVEVVTPFPPNTHIEVELRAWEAVGGDSYEAAIYAGKLAVKSNGSLVELSVPPDPAPYMLGLTGFWFAAPPPPPPSISSQPSSVRVAVDHPWTLEVVATGYEPLAYQWYQDGQPLTGTCKAFLSVAEGRLADSGEYCVVVTNPGGYTKSRVAQVVVGYPLTATTSGPGRIEVQPSIEVFEPGQTVELTAIPAAGAVFEGWQGDVLGTANPATLMMDGPKQVRAWFSLVPLRLEISRQQGKVQFEWTPPAILQSSDVLVPDAWQDVSEVTSPYDPEPANAPRFYRLRRPRRTRNARAGAGPREASWSAAVLPPPQWGEVPTGPGLAPRRVTAPAPRLPTRNTGAPAAVAPKPGFGLLRRRKARCTPKAGSLSLGCEQRATPGRRLGAWLVLLLSWRIICSAMAATPPGETLWELETGSAVVDCPAIGLDGTLYVLTLDGEVFALDGATGRLEWGGAGVQGAGHLALGTDGALYLPGVTNETGILCAVELATRVPRWCIPFVSAWSSPVAQGDNNTIYVAGFARDSVTGVPKWSLGGDSVSQAVGADGTIYVSGATVEGTALSSYDGGTGARRWSQVFPGGQFQFLELAVGWEGPVYVTFLTRFPDRDDAVTLQAREAVTGALTWERPVDYGSTPSIGADGTVYIMIGGQVYALHGSRGSEKWRFVPPPPSSSACSERLLYPSVPVLGADDTLYARNTRALWALDVGSGRKKWEFTPPAGCLHSEITLGPEGTVYVAALEDRDERQTGRLYALQGTAPLAAGGWAKWRSDAQNTGRVVGAPPAIQRQPTLAVLKEGEPGRITVQATGKPTPQFRWTLNSAAVPEGTNASLILSAVTRAQEGIYSLVASNALGQATSAPIVAVVSNVDPLQHPGWRWEGAAGTVTAEASPSVFGPWAYLFRPPAGAMSGFYIETNLVWRSMFYRLRAQSGGRSARFTTTTRIPGWGYQTGVGTRHRIEYVWSGSGWTNWVVLTELTVPESPHLFLDTDALDHPGAVYRTTPVP
jgi:outer membrane protein assembly factor BamB